jgi:uncharacterized repeat protein (TIGR03803 family)
MFNVSNAPVLSRLALASVLFWSGSTSIIQAAPIFQTLYSFNGSDGRFPSSRLTAIGSKLFGSTSSGGTADSGTLFSMNLDGSGFQTLRSFSGPDGRNPSSNLTVLGSTLFGSTNSGGTADFGTLFSMNLDGSGFKTIRSFVGGPNEGVNPQSNLTLVGSKLYGTTFGGGPLNGGSVFELNPDGSGFKTLRFLDASDGGKGPKGDLNAIGSALYGTTSRGGANDFGTVFGINVDGSSLGNLHGFTGSDGAIPRSGVTAVGSRLYGTTSGTFGSATTIFSMNLNGSEFQTLYSFDPSFPNGFGPIAGLTVVDTKLYGLTAFGGPSNNGSLFSINLDGSGFRTLYTFNGSDGSLPSQTLTAIGSKLYGTTTFGGANGKGTVFSIAIPEAGSFALSLGAIATIMIIAGSRKLLRIGQ